VLLRDLAIDRGALKLRESLFVVATGLSGLVIGRVVDRFGPRRVVQLGTLLFGASLLAYSQASSVGTVYLLYALFGLAFCCTHVIVLAVTVSQLMPERRGLVMGILLSATSLGAAAMPLLSSALLQQFGWRQALVVYAALAAANVVVAHFAIPSLRPSAVSPAGPLAPVPGAAPLVGAWRRLVRRDTVLLSLAAFFIFYTSTTFIHHAFLYLRDNAATVTLAAAGVSLLFISGLVGKIGSGWIADRWSVRRAWLAFQAAMVTGAACLAFAPGTLGWFGLAAFGLGWGGCYALTQVMATAILAGPQLGQLMGVFLIVEASGSALGGLLTGMMFDSLGGYRVPFGLAIGFMMAAMLLTTRVREPPRDPR
jgi:MFS family permease